MSEEQRYRMCDFFVAKADFFAALLAKTGPAE